MLKVRPSRATRWKVRSAVGRQHGRHRTGAVHPGSRHLDHGERQARCRLRDLLGRVRIQLGEPVHEQALRRPAW